MWWYSWSNSCGKWIQRPEFKSWMRVFAFHIALVPLENGWIQLFSLQLWVGQTGLLNLGMTTSPGEGKLWILTCYSFHKELTLCHILLLVKVLKIYSSVCQDEVISLSEQNLKLLTLQSINNCRCVFCL